MRSLYAMLNDDAKAWWYHRQLREGGSHAVARELERKHIKSQAKMLRSMVENGGWITIGRGNHVCHFISEDGHAAKQQGYNQDMMLIIAQKLKIPAYDVRQAAETSPAQVVRAIFALDDPKPIGEKVEGHSVRYAGYDRLEVQKHIMEYCAISGAIPYLP